jgi:phage tail sheath protein FI
MPNYLTPDVYVEEISTLPPSVAQVSTAIPAFIGYTEFAGRNGELMNVPTRISTLLEYKTLFGSPDRVKFTVAADNLQAITQTVDKLKRHQLYYALDLFLRTGAAVATLYR